MLIREELERLAEDDGTPPSSLSSRHSHEDDEDKMPEEAFMKYTKDSRTVTPVPASSGKLSGDSRRQGETEEGGEKKVIKVDLRESTDGGSVKGDKAEAAAPESSSTPRRPAPRGPAIQKQRGEVTK